MYMWKCVQGTKTKHAIEANSSFLLNEQPIYPKYIDIVSNKNEIISPSPIMENISEQW